MFASLSDGRMKLSQSRPSFVSTQVTALVEPDPTTIRLASPLRPRLRRGLSADQVAELFDELGAPPLSWFRREVKTRGIEPPRLEE
jgi:hypothetical protein